MTITNETRGTIIATDVEYARSFWSRTRGLIGRNTLPVGYALVFPRCRSVHTCAMTMQVDILHVDRFGHVLRALRELLPWRFGPVVWHGAQVIELPAGTIARTRTQVGDRLAFDTGSVSASHSDQAQTPASATDTLP